MRHCVSPAKKAVVEKCCSTFSSSRLYIHSTVAIYFKGACGMGPKTQFIHRAYINKLSMYGEIAVSAISCCNVCCWVPIFVALHTLIYTCRKKESGDNPCFCRKQSDHVQCHTLPPVYELSLVVSMQELWIGHVASVIILMIILECNTQTHEVTLTN